MATQQVPKIEPKLARSTPNGEFLLTGVKTNAHSDTQRAFPAYLESPISNTRVRRERLYDTYGSAHDV